MRPIGSTRRSRRCPGSRSATYAMESVRQTRTGSGARATVAEVRERLADRLAYTTVLTVLRTLEQKGYVEHTGEGRAHRYHPLVQRDAAGRNALRRLVDKVFQGSPEFLMTHLVSDKNLSDEELRRLRKLLEARIKGGGK